MPMRGTGRKIGEVREVIINGVDPTLGKGKGKERDLVASIFLLLFEVSYSTAQF